MAALRLGDVLRLGGAGAELERDIAVAVALLAGDDLDVVERQHGDRHVAAVVLEQAGHPHLLRDHAGAHDQSFLSEACPQGAGMTKFRHSRESGNPASSQFVGHPVRAGFPLSRE
jgi:hypothetical protein